MTPNYTLTRRQFLKSAAFAAIYSPLPGEEETIGHKFLRINAEIQDVSQQKKMLNDTVREGAKILRRKGIVAGLFAIDEMLTQNSFVLNDQELFCDALTPKNLDDEVINFLNGKPSTVEAETFCKANNRKLGFIRSHQHEKFYYGDCDTYSILEMSAFQLANQAIASVRAPDHMFLRINRDLNWDAARATLTNDAHYIEWLSIPDVSIQQGAYMKNLSPKEITAIEHANMGIAYMNRGQTEKALRHLQKATELDKKYPDALYAKGYLLHKKGDFAGAAAAYEATLKLNPEYKNAIRGRELALERKTI